MTEKITLKINGKEIAVLAGSTVATAVFATQSSFFRRSVSGKPRSPLCGMGVCFECRVKINEVWHQRSCLILAENGMIIETDE